MNHKTTNPSLNDTIVACATPEGFSSIGVIRISGPNVTHLLKVVFKPKHQTDTLESHRAYFGDIYDPITGSIIDKVITTMYRAPHSYTGEDVGEISCHGNPIIIDRIMKALISQGEGVRLASKGEFTKRALLNNKIDLIQAEAVLDTVYSPCDEARKLAISLYEGKLSETIKIFQKEFMDLLTLAEVQIDFNEEEHVIEKDHALRMSTKINTLQSKTDVILTNAKIGIKMREGYRVVIMGRANVGKSTLFNHLLGYERALIHHDPGTTRDYLEERIEFAGLNIRLFDTAGVLNQPMGPDRLAQDRTTMLLDSSDLILLLFDGSEPMNEQDIYLYNLTKGHNTIAIVNKVDLNIEMNETNILSDSVKISAKTGKNINALIDFMKRALVPKPCYGEQPILTRQRHVETFKTINAALQRCRKSPAPETVAFEVRSILHALDILLGITLDKNVLDRIFNEFCIGK